MYLKTLTQKNKSDGHVRKYLQIVESRRVNGSPRQKVLLTLGRVDTPETWQKSMEGIESFDLHQYYRALDYLIDHKDALERRIFNRMRDLFHSQVDIVLFDTTTVAYYGDSEKHEDLLEYGFSKIRRSDLKQIVVGVVMSKEGIPLAHEVFEGNKNDVTCFSEIIDLIASRYNVDRVVLVGDRGMISKDNSRRLEEKKYQYILGYRMRTIPQEDRHKVFEEKEFRKIANSGLQFKEATYNDKGLIVCYNEERAEKDRLHRENILERIKKKIKSGKLTAIVENTHYKRFVRIKGEKPIIDDEKVRRDEMYDGMFVLTTNTHRSAVDVVTAYKDLWQVELAFRQLKSELEMGPIYHWKDRRIRAHVMICFLNSRS